MNGAYPNQWRVLAVLFFTWGVGGLARNSIAFLFPYFSVEFGLGAEHAGFLASTVAFFWALAIIFSGGLVARFGQIKVMVPGLFLGGLFLMGVAMSQAVWMLYVCAAFFGLGCGTLCAPSLSMIAGQSDPKNRGLFIGVMQSGFTLIGSGIGAVVIVKLGEDLGWRTTYVVIGVLVWLVVMLMMVFIGKIKAPPVAKDEVVKVSYGAVLAYKNIKVASVLTCLAMIWFYTVAAFAIIYLIEARGFGTLTAGAIFAGFGLGGFLGEASVPAFSDRLGRKVTLLICSGLGCLAFSGFLFLQVPTFGLTLLLFGAAYFFAGLMPIVVSVVPSESVPISLISTATALTPAIGEMVGGVVAPALGGLLIGLIGIGGVMEILLVVPFAIALGTLFFTETAPRIVAK